MEVNQDKKTKQKIIEAAVDLFFHQGFHQTSVRKIAHHAKVNQALISYYFGSKKGLLEQLMIHFYEGYFSKLEKKEGELRKQKEPATCQEHLSVLLRASFDYLFDSFQVTRIIYRELTLDSTLIREVMTLYLGQEKYYFMSLLEEAQERNELKETDLEMMVLQLLNLLYMPFLQPQVIREVYHIEPYEQDFKERFYLQIHQWIDHRFFHS